VEVIGQRRMGTGCWNIPTAGLQQISAQSQIANFIPGGRFVPGGMEEEEEKG